MKINCSYKIPLSILIAFLFVLNGCKDEEIVPTPQVLKINDFIWENLNEVYLWNEQIP